MACRQQWLAVWLCLARAGCRSWQTCRRRCCSSSPTLQANLHGMPGILGGLASALFSWAYAAPNAALLAHGARQPLWQLAGLGIALAAAVAGGAAAGWLASVVNPAGQELGVGQLYEDGTFWTEGEEEGEEDKAE